jgi:hypothetical protein
MARAGYQEPETDPAYHCRAVVVGTGGGPHHHALARAGTSVTYDASQASTHAMT